MTANRNICPAASSMKRRHSCGSIRRFASALGPFFEGALAQMPDGGSAYYESCNRFLPDPDFAAGLAVDAYGR